ncbi:3459_t:CDS:1, partial [Dentiscutata erythropus]
MSFPRQQRRGFYVTKACTNCKQKHAKCSGRATCERCTLRNLECTFIESGKKRGPKTNRKHLEQIYILNGPENDFNGTSVPSFVIPDAVQGHASTLSFSEYQQPGNINEGTFYSDSYDEKTTHAFQEAGYQEAGYQEAGYQEAGPFSYQTQI